MKSGRLHRGTDEVQEQVVGSPTTTRSARPDVDVVADGPPLIPPGRYEAVGGRASTFRVHHVLKLRVEWVVLVPDETGQNYVRPVNLPRYYNVRPAPEGRVRAGRHSSYVREWVLVTGRRVGRHDRLSPGSFEGVLCEVEVAVVTHDARQQPLPEPARYSKVARVIQRKAGGGS